MCAVPIIIISNKTIIFKPPLNSRHTRKVIVPYLNKIHYINNSINKNLSIPWHYSVRHREHRLFTCSMLSCFLGHNNHALFHGLFRIGVRALLYYVLDAQLFLWPQCLFHRKYTVNIKHNSELWLDHALTHSQSRSHQMYYVRYIWLHFWIIRLRGKNEG
jgi:hypothetical protein